MIILLIAGISLVQLALYYISHRMNWKFPDFLILVLFLLFYYAILPRFFYPEPSPDGINCGMPILGITMAFWVLGTIAGVLTHFLWKLILKFIKTEYNKADKKDG